MVRQGVVQTMLKEYLLTQAPGLTCWSDGMPGVRVCRFALSGREGEDLRPVPARGQPLHFEAFFCQGGRAAAELPQNQTSLVGAGGVYLLSHAGEIRSFQISGDLRGILVAVDAKAARESFSAACAAMGLRLDTGRVRRRMEERHGFAVLPETPWTRSTFACLEGLPEEAQGCYCVFKAVELLYLLCSEPSPPEREQDAHVSPVLAEARAYIQTHLSEKLTIERLCRQFSVSPTFLKEGFRRAYGRSIHSWLMEERVKRARELIRTTRLPIQEVARAVGYEGMSQFNALFKRRYGMTPGQCRKMSETATPRPF